MGSGAKKKKFSMGNSPTDDESLAAQVWCIKNKVYISPVAVTDTQWQIEINGNLDPSIYGKTEVWTKLYEYCKYYYYKYNKKDEQKS